MLISNTLIFELFSLCSNTIVIKTIACFIIIIKVEYKNNIEYCGSVGTISYAIHIQFTSYQVFPQVHSLFSIIMSPNVKD